MSCCQACAKGSPCGTPVSVSRDSVRPSVCPPGAFRFGNGCVVGTAPVLRFDAFTPSSLSACDSLPWMPEHVEVRARRRWELGQTAVEPLSNTILLEIYPTTRDGTPIPWALLPSDAATCLLELRRLVLAQVAALVSRWDFDVARARYSKVGGGA